LSQIVAGIGQKGGSGLFGLHAKARIVHDDPVLSKKLISGFHGPDLAQPELLRQASLPGAE